MLLLYADGDVSERRQESADLASALAKAGNTAARTRQIDDRDHVSIARLLGSEGDATAAAILEFAERVLQGRNRSR